MSAPTESKDPPLIADPQDPLPESGFFWRRIATYIVSLTVLWMLRYIVVALRALESPDGLVTVAQWLIGLLALLLTYYLIAPSAEHIVRLFQTVNAWKSGISTSVMSRVKTSAGTAETKTEAGPAASEELPDYAR